MTSYNYPKQYYIKCSWAARPDDPVAIANRLRRFLDTLGEINETLRPWSIGKRSPAPYRSVRDDLDAMILRDIKHDEDGTIEPKAGYTLLGNTEDRRQHYILVGHAGGTYETFLCNELSLSTCTYNRSAVDAAIVGYPVMKALTLTTVACWQPDFCRAGSSDFKIDKNHEWYEASCWITYVPPQHAASVDLVGVPFSEWTPGGGLLLSATDQAYDAQNPSHLAGTRRIVEATRHLNATLPAY